MRFLEWAQQNPGGVISLPTGKTPEHFIDWVKRLLSTWDLPETRAQLEQAGIDPAELERSISRPHRRPRRQRAADIDP